MRENKSAISGTPALVHQEKNLGACPSSAMPCSVRVAENSRPLPALKIDVMIRAFTT